MTLFPELAPPTDAAASTPRRCHMVTRTWREAVRVLLWLKQLALPMPLRRLERDIDTAFDFPTRAFVRAQEAAPVATSAASSVFALADAIKAAKTLRQRGRFGEAAGFEPPPYRVEREGDRVRVVRLRPEETTQWQERERVRRAKQRPPKPTKLAKTRGKKVRQWDGEGDEWSQS